MGIVVDQTIRNVIITCLGFGIGAVNTLFLFTNFLNEEYYGLVAYVMSTSNLIWPLMAFGVHNTLIKFFSSYSDTEQRNKFLTLMLILPLVIALVLGGLGTIFYSSILSFFEGKNAIIQPFVWTIFVLAFVLSYFEIFFAWSKVKLKSVFGNIMKELFVRICISILLILVYFKVFSANQFIYALIVVYVARTLIMKIYALRLHSYQLNFSLPDNYRSVLKYAMLILIAGSVATLLIDLDKTMIERYLPIGNVAKYGICAYIASVIIIPSRAMHQITYPLTAKLMNEKQFNQLKELYKKSSINLLVISGLLFVLVVCNMKELFEIIPDEYVLFVWVVLLIGGTKLFDNIMGNNNAILFSSDYYKLVLFIGVSLAILAIILNLICIPIFGVTGAAIATFTAVFCYNLIKLWVVYSKFKMHPFSKHTFITILLIIGFVVSFYFWEFGFHPLLNITLKSIIIGIIYLAVVYVLKISPELHKLIAKYL